uniref:EamA-like transporter family protein n=1 Tax=Candidatus Kentrum sp. FW TaxID=2126338 RepID=A0A450TQ42_9GAMM|nr:MAG: EamA-like transporter family protein [Candidatus Kentron sp. FW]
MFARFTGFKIFHNAPAMMILASLMVASAQILFKLASTQTSQHIGIHVFLSWQVWMGVVAYFMAFLFSLRGFQLGSISVTAPFFGLAYVWTTLVGYIFFDDHLNAPHILGLGLVIGGAYLLAGES